MDSLTCLLTSTQDSLVEYGIILLSMKQYDESLDVFREAFQLRQREAHLTRKTESAQETQLKMAKIRHNIGCVTFELGKMEEAKEAYVDAIEQQKSAFGTWSTPFMIMTDTTKPGFLTMASTMCNKGKYHEWSIFQKLDGLSGSKRLTLLRAYLHPQGTLILNKGNSAKQLQSSLSH